MWNENNVKLYFESCFIHRFNVPWHYKHMWCEMVMQFRCRCNDILLIPKMEILLSIIIIRWGGFVRVTRWEYMLYLVHVYRKRNRLRYECHVNVKWPKVQLHIKAKAKALNNALLPNAKRDKKRQRQREEGIEEHCKWIDWCYYVSRAVKYISATTLMSCTFLFI